MDTFENKSIGWLVNQAMKAQARIETRSRLSEEQLTKSNQSDQNLLEELTTELLVHREKEYTAWFIQNKHLLDQIWKGE